MENTDKLLYQFYRGIQNLDKEIDVCDQISTRISTIKAKYDLEKQSLQDALSDSKKDDVDGVVKSHEQLHSELDTINTEIYELSSLSMGVHEIKMTLENLKTLIVSAESVDTEHINIGVNAMTTFITKGIASWLSDFDIVFSEALDKDKCKYE